MPAQQLNNATIKGQKFEIRHKIPNQGRMQTCGLVNKTRCTTVILGKVLIKWKILLNKIEMYWSAVGHISLVNYNKDVNEKYIM